ncbi:MAG: hypothetical protein NC310_08160 [Roseburia sp.]|nr:hypothetical protein [Anaeroplasma bactoclasticum]MCM1197022.1 hypothetical protein [Roseburia sp.]MCM1556669.1 hypothetical protein [Anaeroplasma bactoclasticum]
MKKNMILVVFFIFSLSLCACSEKKESDLELFIEKFQALNSEDYKIEDGWYRYTSSSVYYNTEDMLNKTVTIEFLGDLAFQSKTCSGSIKKSSFKCSTTTFEKQNQTISVKTEYSETYTDQSDLFRLKCTAIDSNIIEKYSEGKNNLEDVPFSFLIGSDYTNLLSLSNIGSKTDTYKAIKISKINKNLKDISYKLTIEWENFENNIQSFVTDEYYFDPFYRLFKMIRIDESKSKNPIISSSYTTKIFEACEEKNIEVPTSFDKELSIDYMDYFKF